MFWLSGVLLTTLREKGAFLYLDSGSGSFLIHLLIASLAAGGILIASQRASIKR